jgi:endonuclease-3
MQSTALQSERARAQKILEKLRKELPIRDEDFASRLIARETRDPFRILVVTILSQSCTDIAALQAYRNLDNQIGVTIPELSRARAPAISRAIRMAGLHRQKSKAFRRLAQTIEKNYAGNLKIVLEGELDEVRSRLQELPKVGPKTAEVLLGILGYSTISVDTHVNRVSKRLGFAMEKAKYEETRAALMQVFRDEDRTHVPLLLMAHGRTFCKARKPLCYICPVEKHCPYPLKTKNL